MVLASQFKSFIQPFVSMLSLPLNQRNDKRIFLPSNQLEAYAEIVNG
jgi:hypothetical protein